MTKPQGVYPPSHLAKHPLLYMTMGKKTPIVKLLTLDPQSADRPGLEPGLGWYLFLFKLNNESTV